MKKSPGINNKNGNWRRKSNGSYSYESEGNMSQTSPYLRRNKTPRITLSAEDIRTYKFTPRGMLRSSPEAERQVSQVSVIFQPGIRDVEIKILDHRAAALNKSENLISENNRENPLENLNESKIKEDKIGIMEPSIVSPIKSTHRRPGTIINAILPEDDTILLDESIEYENNTEIKSVDLRAYDNSRIIIVKRNAYAIVKSFGPGIYGMDTESDVITGELRIIQIHVPQKTHLVKSDNETIDESNKDESVAEATDEPLTYIFFVEDLIPNKECPLTKFMASKDRIKVGVDIDGDIHHINNYLITAAANAERKPHESWRPNATNNKNNIKNNIKTYNTMKPSKLFKPRFNGFIDLQSIAKSLGETVLSLNKLANKYVEDFIGNDSYLGSYINPTQEQYVYAANDALLSYKIYHNLINRTPCNRYLKFEYHSRIGHYPAPTREESKIEVKTEETIEREPIEKIAIETKNGTNREEEKTLLVSIVVPLLLESKIKEWNDVLRFILHCSDIAKSQSSHERCITIETYMDELCRERVLESRTLPNRNCYLSLEPILDSVLNGGSSGRSNDSTPELPSIDSSSEDDKSLSVSNSKPLPALPALPSKKKETKESKRKLNSKEKKKQIKKEAELKEIDRALAKINNTSKNFNYRNNNNINHYINNNSNKYGEPIDEDEEEFEPVECNLDTEMAKTTSYESLNSVMDGVLQKLTDDLIAESRNLKIDINVVAPTSSVTKTNSENGKKEVEQKRTDALLKFHAEVERISNGIDEIQSYFDRIQKWNENTPIDPSSVNGSSKIRTTLKQKVESRVVNLTNFKQKLNAIKDEVTKKHALTTNTIEAELKLNKADQLALSQIEKNLENDLEGELNEMVSDPLQYKKVLHSLKTCIRPDENPKPRVKFVNQLATCHGEWVTDFPDKNFRLLVAGKYFDYALSIGDIIPSLLDPNKYRLLF